MNKMNPKALLVALAIAAALSAGSLSAEEKKAAKPYPLKTCIVTDEALNGDHGKPYVFVEDGQEIQLCCKSCLKKFNKDKAKYLAKLQKPAKAK